MKTTKAAKNLSKIVNKFVIIKIKKLEFFPFFLNSYRGIMKIDLAFHLTNYGFYFLGKKQQKSKSVKPNIFFSFLG